MRTNKLIQLIAILQLFAFELMAQGTTPVPATIIKYQVVASFSNQYSLTAIQAFVQQLNGTVIDYDNNTNSVLIKLNPIRINNQDYLGYGSVNNPQKLVKASDLLNNCQPFSVIAQGVPSGGGAGNVSSQGDGWNYAGINSYSHSVATPWTSAIESAFYAQFTSQSVAQGVCNVQVAIDDSGYNNGVVTGVQPSPFVNMLLGSSKNYINTGMNPIDTFGHGTFVSGIVTGVVRSITRTGTKVKLVPYKILNRNGSGTFWSLIKSLSDLSLTSVNIVNLSVRAILPCQIKATDKHPLNLALDKLRTQNKLLICAAGNDGIDIGPSGTYFVYPASLSPAYPTSMLTVGSITSTNTLSSFSNYGTPVQLYTYGENISSTLPGINRGVASGTSFSTPRVSGVAALMGTYMLNSGRCEFNPAKVTTYLKNFSDPFGGNTGKILNAALVYQKLISNNLPDDGETTFRINELERVSAEDELSAIAFPNPFRDQLQIQLHLPENSRGALVALINLQGSTVQQKSIDASGQQINDLFTGDLPSGLYLLSVRTAEGQVQTLKLIKE